MTSTTTTSRFTLPHRVAAVCATLALGACSGGGEDKSTPAPPAQAEVGTYVKRNPDLNATIRAIVLPNGRTYTLFDTGTNAEFALRGDRDTKLPGFRAPANLGHSIDRRDPIAPSRSIDLTAHPSAIESSDPTKVTLTFTPASGKVEHGDLPRADAEANRRADLAMLAGSEWDVVDPRTDQRMAGYLRMGIDADGALQSIGAQCVFNGRVTPVDGQVRAFTFKGTFGPAPCPLPDSTVEGIAVPTLVPGQIHDMSLYVTDTENNARALLINMRRTN